MRASPDGRGERRRAGQRLVDDVPLARRSPAKWRMTVRMCAAHDRRAARRGASRSSSVVRAAEPACRAGAAGRQRDRRQPQAELVGRRRGRRATAAACWPQIERVPAHRLAVRAREAARARRRPRSRNWPRRGCSARHLQLVLGRQRIVKLAAGTCRGVSACRRAAADRRTARRRARRAGARLAGRERRRRSGDRLVGRADASSRRPERDQRDPLTDPTSDANPARPASPACVVPALPLPRPRSACVWPPSSAARPGLWRLVELASGRSRAGRRTCSRSLEQRDRRGRVARAAQRDGEVEQRVGVRLPALRPCARKPSTER